MRRFLPLLLLSLAASAPFAMGCDLLKQKAADAGADGAVAVADPNAPATAVNPAAPVVTTAAPLNPATPTPTVAHPVDAGHVADSGVKTDAGGPPPIPTFPGFDAGAFKGFDAGAFKGFDAGKLPWMK